MKQRPIVIDCDPGIDDAFALMLAASRPELDIRAVNPVCGNVEYRYTAENALRLVGLLGLDCRVGRGAEQPLIIPRADAQSVHGVNGMGGYELPAAAGKSFDPDYAWEILYREAKEVQGGLEVVALGPLTNVAIALLRYPGLAGMLRKITLMGGSASMGNIGAYAEFNIGADPHAADVVFRSGVPIAMVGFDACFSCGLNGEELRRLVPRGGKLRELIQSLCESLQAVYRGFGLPEVVLFDLVAMACFVRPQIARYKSCLVEVETQSSLSSGQTLVDLYRLSGRQPNAEVLLRADKPAFLALLDEMTELYRT